MEVDKEFLEKILGEPVSSFKLSEGTNPGDNVAGALTSIAVTLSSGRKLSLVNKTYSDDPEFRDYAIQFGLFATENTFYNTVVPRIASLLKLKSNGTSSTSGFPVPKFYAGNGDLTKGEEFLCMEDVRPQGYSMKNKFLAFNLAEVSLILKELGRFHASSHFWIRYEGERIFEDDPGLKRYRDSVFSMGDPMMIVMGTNMFSLELASAIKVLEHEGHKELAGRVRSKILDLGKTHIFELVKKKSWLTDKSMFPCIIHGDLWMNNILLKYNSDCSEPTDAMFVDFQQSRRGNIFEDLNYFILTSTTPSFRKQHLVHVLNIYYESFAATLNSIGCPIPIGFSRGTLIDTFFDGLLSGYVYMCFAIPMQLADPVDSKAKAAAMQEACQGGDSAAAPPDPSTMTPEQMMLMMVKGLEARSEAFHAQMLKSPRAIERLVDITKEMAEMKLF